MAQTTIAGGFLSTDVVSAQTALTSGLVSTDELIVSDAGVLKRMDISVLESYIVTNLGDNNIDVAQSTHGFAVGDIIRLTTTDNTYAKAQADSAANAEAIGIVIDVTDTNNFTYSTSGEITVAGAVPNSTTAGDIIYLSPSTAGAVQNSEPSTDGQVSKPIGIITEANNKMVLVPYRGEVLSSGRNNWDVNGSELVLDANGNTSITADTDDQIDIKLSGADDYQFTANSFTALAGSTITSPSFITGNSGTLRFNDGDGSHYTTLAAHATTTTNVAYTLPPADGSSNQVLTTAGNGVLSWTTPSGGAALTGSTNNTLVTVTGADAIAGESTLTYDASGNTNVLELTNAGSASNNHARIKISATHASGGDPVVEWRTADTNSWSIGTDHSDDDNFYLMSNSQPGQGTNTIVMKVDRVTGSGSGANSCSQFPQITKPMQSCGTVRVSSDINNQTGDGNQYQVTFGTVEFDQNADWSTSNNNTFYAPVAGVYLFIVQISFKDNLSADSNEILVYLNTSYDGGTNYNLFNQPGRPDGIGTGDPYSTGGSVIAKMDAGDFANVKVRVSGDGSNNVQIEGGGGFASFFSWALLA